MRTECCCLLVKQYFVFSFFHFGYTYFMLDNGLMVCTLSVYAMIEKNRDDLWFKGCILDWVIKARFIIIIISLTIGIRHMLHAICINTFILLSNWCSCHARVNSRFWIQSYSYRYDIYIHMEIIVFVKIWDHFRCQMMEEFAKQIHELA